MALRDVRPVDEAVGAALASGDLRQRPGPCDLDKIMALGLVGIRNRAADAVYRLKYANDPKAYHEALSVVYGIARSLDTRNHWRYRRTRLRWMAKRVLDYWIADLCPVCTGVKFESVPGTPHLSDRACGFCHGTGKRSFPWVRRLPRRPEGRTASRQRIEHWKKVIDFMAKYMERHRTLLSQLEAVERNVTEVMAKRLGRAA